MRGSRHYTYEIATCADDGRWTVLVTQSGEFTRTPTATARSIAERWILEQARRLPGGRLVIHGKRGKPPKSFSTRARIIVRDPHTSRRLAAAFIGSDWRDMRAAGNVSGGPGNHQPTDLNIR